MRKFWTTILGAAAAVGLALPVTAGGEGRHAGAKGANPPDSAAAAPAGSSEDARIASDLVLASGVVDRPVAVSSGKSDAAGSTEPDGAVVRGKVVVEDVLIDAKAGKVTHLVLSHEGEENFLAVPLAAFRIEQGESTSIEFDVALDAMPADCPSFEKGRYESEKDTARLVGSEKATRLVRFDRLKDFRVEGADENEIGEFDDLVFDSRTGEIRAALVTSGGFLGMGEALHLIPWRLSSIGDGDELVVRVSETENRDRVQSFPLSRGDEARREFTGRALRPEESARPAEGRAVAILLEPNAVHRYSVESVVATADVAGWESGREGEPAELTVTERWTGIYDVRVVEVRDNGDSVVEAKIRETGKDEDAVYRAVVTREGRVTDVRRMNETGDVSVLNDGLDEERVKAHLTMIFGGGLAGREVTGEPIDAPEALRPYCGHDHETTIRYTRDPETAEKGVRVFIRANDRELGSASYGERGLLNVLEIRPQGEDACSLRIRALEPLEDRRVMDGKSGEMEKVR